MQSLSLVSFIHFEQRTKKEQTMVGWNTFEHVTLFNRTLFPPHFSFISSFRQLTISWCVLGVRPTCSSSIMLMHCFRFQFVWKLITRCTREFIVWVIFVAATPTSQMRSAYQRKQREEKIWNPVVFVVSAELYCVCLRPHQNDTSKNTI